MRIQSAPLSLAAGTRFGPYEILSPLGAGGMGEVYRARDTTLQRAVAIKVLPERLARDPDRIARLRREATTLAALNDPNIAAIFGFEDAGGRHALILELVEGPTLAERLAQGPLPVPEALAIARQIGKALDAAHQHGIIHRDLKPANIKVRDDGTVKVLDFGLAKALDDAAAVPGTDAASSPTSTSPAALTEAGAIIGSAAYMSPEQARGRPADKRSDIWAFGCVLYEMLTGRRAFPGDGVTEALAAVLRGEPDWRALPADVPAATRTLLARCLEKDRAERVQDISTARFVLAEQANLSGTSSRAQPVVAPPSQSRSRVAVWIAIAAALGLIAGAAATLLWRPQATSPAPRTARFDLASRAEPLATGSFGTLVALSPDGTRVVYTALRDGVSRLVMRPTDRLEATPITGTEGAVDPFFSPDGRQVGFFDSNDLKRIPIDGGQGVTIWRGDPTFEGATWDDDETIVFSQGGFLYRVSESGGQATKIAEPDAAHDETGYLRPVILRAGPASGKVLLYTIGYRDGHDRIVARRLPAGEPTPVLEGYGARYLAPGYLVFAQADRLMAVAFDAATLRVSGEPVLLEQGVFTSSAEGVSNVATAADGSAVFVSGRNPGALGRPVWVNRTGAHAGHVVDAPLEVPRNLRLSPDGKRLALTVGPPGQGNIWVYDVAGSRQPIRLTFRDHNLFAVWSRDGRQIAFMNIVGSISRDFSIAADGSVLQAQILATGRGAGAPMDWSPSESALLLYQETALWLLRPPDQTATPWMPAPFPQFGARFSPDGRWVAYASAQSGPADIWVRPFPGPGAPIRVSSSGGHEPVWSHDGRELFFTTGSKMMSARVTMSGGDLRVEPPHLLFDGGFKYDPVDLVVRYYDVAPDGRFMMIEPSGSNTASIVIAQHWAEELKARLAK